MNSLDVLFDLLFCHTAVRAVVVALHVTPLVLIFLQLEVSIFWQSSSNSVLPPCSTSGNHKRDLFFYDFFLDPHINEIIQHFSFSVWLSSLSTMPSSSTYVLTSVRVSLLLMTEWYFIVCVYIYLLLHPFIHQLTLTLFPCVGYHK